MKPIHFLSIASALLALGLAVAGFSKLAALPIALATVVEIIASAILGKQSNEGTDGPPGRARTHP